MSLNISKVYNANKYADAKKTYGNDKNAAVSMLQRNTASFDKSSDGKFTVSEALKNFAKGIVSPITSMFSSKTAFLTGVGMIAGSAALVIATGGAATPLLVMAGVAMGTAQAANAGYKIIKAKNGDDVEKAFYEIGGATSTIGLSAWGAKGSLKQAGIETEGLSHLQAVAKCFKSAKALAQESLMTFRTGFFKINIKSFIKSIGQPKELKVISEKLYKEGLEKKDSAFKEVKDIFPESYHENLECRVKGKNSIYDKILAWFKQNKLKNKNFKMTEEIAKEKVNDLLGFRYTPKNASPEEIQEVHSYIIKAIEEDKILIKQIKNYTGTGGEYYFSTEQCKAIKAAAARRGITIDLIERPKSSGYCSTQFKMEHPNGALSELQIRGKLVNEVDSGEHLFYDLKEGKDIFKGNNQKGELFYELEKAIRKLSPEQLKEYQEYRKACYKFARQTEEGLNPQKPELPSCCDKILSIESLGDLCAKAKNLHEINKEAFLLMPQFNLFSGILPTFNKN